MWLKIRCFISRQNLATSETWTTVISLGRQSAGEAREGGKECGVECVKYLQWHWTTNWVTEKGGDDAISGISLISPASWWGEREPSLSSHTAHMGTIYIIPVFKLTRQIMQTGHLSSWAGFRLLLRLMLIKAVIIMTPWWTVTQRECV